MTELADATRIALRPWCRLRLDAVRDRWVLLAPERVLFPCPISVAILERLTEARTLAGLVDDLALSFEAPPETIRHDLLPLLLDLAEQGVLDLGREEPAHG
jgi:pyrroloquinoline quinone biosynthesis protein D